MLSNGFNELTHDEAVELNGGFWPVIEGIFVVLAGYAVVREIVRDAGRDAAYRDLGY